MGNLEPPQYFSHIFTATTKMLKDFFLSYQEAHVIKLIHIKRHSLSTVYCLAWSRFGREPWSIKKKIKEEAWYSCQFPLPSSNRRWFIQSPISGKQTCLHQWSLTTHDSFHMTHDFLSRPCQHPWSPLPHPSHKAIPYLSPEYHLLPPSPTTNLRLIQCTPFTPT